MRSARTESKSPQQSDKQGAGTADILAFCNQAENSKKPQKSRRGPPPSHAPCIPVDPKILLKEKEIFKQIHAAPEHLGLGCLQRTNRRPDNRTFHAVEIVKRNGEVFFYKQHNPKLNPLLPELEAVAWSFYHLVAPTMVPEEVNAHFDEAGRYDGISVKGIPGFESIREKPLREEDLQDDDILKGLGVGLALSYIFAEEDLHTGNIDKYGRRIDFDMSLYPILGRFKQHLATIHEQNIVELHERYVVTRLVDGTIIDWQYRPYHKDRYEIDEYDIEHFPDIRVASPFYWVTKSGPVHTDIRQGFARAFPTSTNAIDNADIENYKKLTNISTFRKHLYKTLLKFLLIDDSYFVTEAKKHIRTHLKWLDDNNEIKPIYRSLVEFVSERKKTLRRKLTNMDEFFKFLCRDGEWAIKEIIEEFKDANQMQLAASAKQTYNGLRLFDNDLDASTRLNSTLFHTDSIRRSYDAIFQQTLDNSYMAMANRTTNDMFTALLELVLMDDKQFKDVTKGYINLYRQQINGFEPIKAIADKIILGVNSSIKQEIRSALIATDEFKDFLEKQASECLRHITPRIDRNDQQIKYDFDAICAEALNLTSTPRPQRML